MKRGTAIIAVIVVAVILLSTSAYTVKESQQVVIVRLGEVVKIVTDPGLHFKIPFIQDVRRFEKRWLEWDGDANQITTRDKRYIYIDVFARWRISDPRVFIEKLQDERSAQGRLDDIIDNATRNVVANHNLIEAIRTTSRAFTEADEESILTQKASETVPPEPPIEPPPPDNPPAPAETDTDSDADPPDAGPPSEEIAAPAPAPEHEAPTILADATPAKMRSAEISYNAKQGRHNLTRLILEKASAKAAQLGIEIKDVQIKRINYIESVEAKVFDRMISERKRVAEAFRSVGQGRYAEIVGRMDKDLKRIRSEAYRKAQEIMGQADAEAARVYANAYRRNPELYNFLKTLESYGQTVDESSWLLLTTDSDYGRHLRTMKGKTP